MAQVSTPHAFKAKLLAMMVLRVVLALAFLGITVWFQIGGRYSFGKFNFYPIYAIVIAIGVLTISYALALNRIKNLNLFAYVQLTIDVALITIIVYVTGGTESYLHTLYSLSVIGGAILLNKRGGFFAASISSMAYGVLIDLDFYRVLPNQYKIIDSPLIPEWKNVLTTASTDMLAFFTVAYLTGYLAEKTARAERELKEKGIDYEKLEVLNRHVVENITSGIMTLDEDLRITSFNREAENVTGYSLKEVYYRSVHHIFPDMIPLDMVQGGIRLEKISKRKNGEEIYLGFSVSHGTGGDMRYIVIFQDLTQLKAMEEQLRRDDKLRALGELSVGIAHEIRNPLASISGSIQLLKGELELGGENLRLMDIVLRETDRLNTLITDYLLFARPAREKREMIDLSGIIGETVRMFSNSKAAASIKIESNIDGHIFVRGSERQLGQVFWNLFLNAASAMPDGGKLVLTATTIQNEELKGGVVEITVADTGHGIRPEDLDRIFDPFFSTRDSGTGLGLAIVHRIIESHEGSIEVRSAPGKGTAFKITIPLLEARALN